MNRTSILNLIKTVEIFSSLPEDLLEQVANRLQILSFLPDATIIQKGDHGDSMFVIANGKVKVHDGDHIVAQGNTRAAEDRAAGQEDRVDEIGPEGHREPYCQRNPGEPSGITPLSFAHQAPDCRSSAVASSKSGEPSAIHCAKKPM